MSSSGKYVRSRFNCAHPWSRFASTSGTLGALLMILTVTVKPSTGSTTVYWKQAMLSAHYTESPVLQKTAVEMAALYSSHSKIAVESGPTTYSLIVVTTSLDLCNASHTVGVRSGAPVAILARSGGCTVEQKISCTQRLGASVLLVYNESQTGQASLAYLANNPLRLTSSPGQALQSVGLSSLQGSKLEKLLRNGTLVTLNIKGRRSYNHVLQASNFLMYFTILLVSASSMCLYLTLARYAWLYIQTRRQTLSQRSRADQARDILSTIPEQVLEESLLHDGDHVTCAICIDDLEIGDTIRTLPCNHAFHKSCIDRWLVSRQTCPLCKFNILTGVIEHEGEMNVRDAAAEIARGSIPPDVLEQAAALPLPPSRLSMFLDGRQPSSVSPAATGSRSNSRLQAQSPLPGMLEDTAFSEVLMLDRSNSMLAVPSRSSRSRHNTSDASRNISQSALGSQRRSRPPEIAARPNTSASTWRVAFSTSRRDRRHGRESVSPRERGAVAEQPSQHNRSLLTRIFMSTSHIDAEDERRPLSDCSLEELA